MGELIAIVSGKGGTGKTSLCAGIAQGWDNLRGRKLLDEGQDPNIIDVEKV